MLTFGKEKPQVLPEKTAYDLQEKNPGSFAQIANNK
jgi:hypothetical protein